MNQTPSGKLSITLVADLQRQPRLPQTAHAEQGEQARTFEHFLDFLALPFAADERRQLLWEIVRRRLELAQRRKILIEPRVDDLEHRFGGRQALEPHRAQVA